MKLNLYLSRFLIVTVLIGAWGLFPTTLHAAELFASPDEAVKTLRTATAANDKAALKEIFGPQIKDLLTGDDVQDAKNAQKFASILAEGYNFVNVADDKITIEIGKNNWPMPIPLVKTNGQWYFDTAAGTEEIINRHIGKDELHAVGVCRAFLTTQQLMAEAKGPKPFHGYYFKVLKRQANSVPGGYALVAYPANWDHSGIMTFIVNQDGKVYQRNLGVKTLRIARAMKVYNPDSTWDLIEDEGIAN